MHMLGYGLGLNRYTMKVKFKRANNYNLYISPKVYHYNHLQILTFVWLPQYAAR